MQHSIQDVYQLIYVFWNSLEYYWAGLNEIPVANVSVDNKPVLMYIPDSKVHGNKMGPT